MGQVADTAEGGWGLVCVIQAAYDDGTVYVAFYKVDQDFLADARDELFAVVLSG